MQRNASTYLVCLAALALIATGRAEAQDDIEAGATEPSSTSIEARGSTSGGVSTRTRGDNFDDDDGPGDGGVRLGIQLRLDALNALGPLDSTDSGVETIGRRLLVPLVAPGVRLLDEKLFIGVGLSLHGWSSEEPNGDEASRSGFGLNPLITFDVLRDGFAALHLLAALNIASLGETETCGGPMNMCVDGNDDIFGVGLTLGAGVRGLISPGLSLGAEFGWGFLSTSADNDDSVFVHGLFGALILEASVGL
jgi:hypothetical protein